MTLQDEIRTNWTDRVEAAKWSWYGYVRAEDVACRFAYTEDRGKDYVVLPYGRHAAALVAHRIRAIDEAFKCAVKDVEYRRALAGDVPTTHGTLLRDEVDELSADTLLTYLNWYYICGRYVRDRGAEVLHASAECGAVEFFTAGGARLCKVCHTQRSQIKDTLRRLDGCVAGQTGLAGMYGHVSLILKPRMYVLFPYGAFAGAVIGDSVIGCIDVAYKELHTPDHLRKVVGHVAYTLDDVYGRFERCNSVKKVFREYGLLPKGSIDDLPDDFLHEHANDVINYVNSVYWEGVYGQ